MGKPRIGHRSHTVATRRKADTKPYTLYTVPHNPFRGEENAPTAKPAATAGHSGSEPGTPEFWGLTWEETYGDEPCGKPDCEICEAGQSHAPFQYPEEIVFKRDNRLHVRVADALALFDRHPGWRTKDHKDCLEEVHGLGKDACLNAVKAFLVHIETNREAYPVVGKQERGAVREWQKVKRILKARLSPRWFKKIPEPWRAPLQDGLNREADRLIEKWKPFETSIRRATKSGPPLGAVTIIVKGLCKIMRDRTRTHQPHGDLVYSIVCKFFPDEVSDKFRDAGPDAIAHMERTRLC